MNSRKQVKPSIGLIKKILKALQRKLNELNSEVAQLKSLVFEQFIFTKKFLQEINDLYQQNENTFPYTKASIKQIDDLKEETKMKNRIIDLLVIS